MAANFAHRSKGFRRRVMPKRRPTTENEGITKLGEHGAFLK